MGSYVDHIWPCYSTPLCAQSCFVPYILTVSLHLRGGQGELDGVPDLEGEDVDSIREKSEKGILHTKQ